MLLSQLTKHIYDRQVVFHCFVINDIRFWHGVKTGIPTDAPSVAGVSLYMTWDDGIVATSSKRTKQAGSVLSLKKFELTELDLPY
ncbi:hypothetical protein [Dyadobacter fanqingshengii]|uniref:Uncharacterized protein n=1 Tax=Dyadobacter fanqingshengii TaxID=2906443 RepID=A0A9X1P7E8_9BACT|nr:hypothetical protein [Dyadobacter fanqingshengii]MCF0039746.1 hypothetical protein [Dyadobacter fanqingshengii]USJ38492.1 hypothetical protein NFI81_12065 [Dyadobacter fanqingshengii]